MASLVPYSVQDLMDEIYVAVDNDPTSSSDSTQDEWTARLRLINMGIAAWERQDVDWLELRTKYTYPTTVPATRSITLTSLTDYRELLGSFVRFYDVNGNPVERMDVINPKDAEAFDVAEQRKCYVTGNAKAGWALNFCFTPAATDPIVGQSMSFWYYKSAAKVSLATDVIEMSDPQYLVSYVSAKKNLFNGRSGIAQDYLDDAQECMDNMRIKNETGAPYQDNRLPDGDLVRDGSSLGL